MELHYQTAQGTNWVVLKCGVILLQALIMGSLRFAEKKLRKKSGKIPLNKN